MSGDRGISFTRSSALKISPSAGAGPWAVWIRRMSGSSRRVAAAIAVFLCLGAAQVSAQVVSNTFEDGTTQGWISRGSAVLSSSTEAAHDGNASLKTTGRTDSWNGPSLDLRSRLLPNTTYRVTGRVRLVEGQPASNLKFTVEQLPTGGTSSSFTQVGSAVQVTDSAWVQLEGNYSFASGDNATLLLYLESDDPTSAYYLDDFSITTLAGTSCPEPLDQSGLSSDFEDGTTQGWGPRGGVTLTNTTNAAFAGTRSLETTGRTASWQGPSLNVLCKMHKGFQYVVSVWVRLLPGEAASLMRVSLQADLNGTPSFLTVIGNQNVTDGAWVNFRTNYTLSTDADQLQLYVETDSTNASFYIDDFSLTHNPPKPIQTDIPSLKDVITEFSIGAAISAFETSGRHRQLVLKHFERVTVGNEMKWSSIHPSEGTYNFGPADTIANFARDNGLKMHGHTLLWHQQVSPWVFQDTSGNPLQAGNAAHRELLIQRLRSHIQTVVARYRDVVDSWDVINEAIDGSQQDGLRVTPWLQIIGPEYIDLAFQFAHEAGADKLYINDFNTHEPARLAALQNVVEGLISRGVPVDGVGHQTHVQIFWPSLDEIRDSIQIFARMGLDNQVTELDVSAYSDATNTAPVSEETLVQQGYRYRDLFNLFRELKDSISVVTLWGLGDDGSWLKTFPITRDDKPLLFDEQLQAKHAYWGIVDPLRLPVIPKTLQVVNGTAKIDGSREAGWNSVAAQPLHTREDAASWAQFSALWSKDTLYLFAEVDDRFGKGDRIDVYLGAAHYVFKTIGKQHKPNVESMLLPTHRGYRLEAAIKPGRSLAVNDELSFDIRVTDSGDARLSWSDTAHLQDMQTSNFGELVLIAAP